MRISFEGHISRGESALRSNILYYILKNSSHAVDIPIVIKTFMALSVNFLVLSVPMSITAMGLTME